jgi:lipopolysaccharide heptosyltransferase II
VPRRLAHCRENPYQLLTDWVPDPEPTRAVRHEVLRQLDLVATVGFRAPDERLSLRLPGQAVRSVDALLARLGLEPGRGWLVVHPGASAPSRRYPAEGFAEVTRRLVAATGARVLLTGTSDEHAIVDEIGRATPGRAHGLAGRLDLAELAALIARAPLLISNNTGPVHIAAAVGTPVVDLYALTNPQHTPWQVPHRVLFQDVPCKFCYKSVCPEGHQNCLRRVEPQAVVDAALELLAAA